MSIHIEEANLAMFEVCRVIGLPSWFHSITLCVKEDTKQAYIKVTTNERIKEDIVQTIPRKVKEMDVRVFYKNPLSRMMGR